MKDEGVQFNSRTQNNIKELTALKKAAEEKMDKKKIKKQKEFTEVEEDEEINQEKLQELLKQVETSSERNGQKIITTFGYDNYTPITSYAGDKTIKGVQIAFYRKRKDVFGERALNIITKIQSVKINEGVSKADFK